MTAVKAEQPAPEQPPAAPVVGGHNLDNLQSMLNLIFLQSGRFIKEHQSGGGTGRMKIAMQRAVPVATERFHDALDELENEVRLAQVVLRRDLALLKQDRKKREVAAKEKEAETARLAAESKNTPPVEKPAPVVEKVSTPAPQEVPAEKEPAAQAEPEKPLEREQENVPPPIDTSVAEPTERDPLFDGTPTTANPQENEFDFDAMFGDAMDTSNDAGHDDMMSGADNMDFNFDEGPSLLRGLEDFAKSGDDTNVQPEENVDIDISMPDLPELNPAIEPSLPPEPAAATKTPTPPAAPAPAEPEPAANVQAANNDATNNATAGDDAASNDDLMGGMMTDNLDDLFNMDDYENPEQSSFDDAFSFFE
ncbi:hypothetical protein DE146DRAFT_705312 [Phaeosphaeria sp. MPI-PUGE-AT-0046c]|nr:hypothetical protein DE146DRAFT_705312 [Phaeosphaeria sp. MPI-PUGE-AT-0046c]